MFGRGTPLKGSFTHNGVSMGSIHKLFFNMHLQSFNHEIWLSSPSSSLYFSSRIREDVRISNNKNTVSYILLSSDKTECSQNMLEVWTVMNTCISPCEYVIKEGTSVHHPASDTFTCMLLGLFWFKQFVSEIPPQKMSGMLDPGIWVAKNPFTVIRSPKTSFNISTVVLAAWHTASSCWIEYCRTFQ